MGNLDELMDSDPNTGDTAHSGTGCATTLPMSNKEKAAVQPRSIGFIWTEAGQEQ